jgi:hypothetical protein
VFLSFAAKKSLDDVAPLATIKRESKQGDSYKAVEAALAAQITEARGDQASHIDRELSLLLRLPGFVLAFLIAVMKRLYVWGLAPRSLVDTDPLYTSAFVANLGSLKLDAAYHHLHEHGNCPLFVTIGQVKEVPVAEHGAVIIRPSLTLRYTFDERVEDGLYCARALQMLAHKIEDPISWISPDP